MKFSARMTAGTGCPLANCLRILVAAMLILVGGAVFAQAMYKYQDENGEWIFTDRPPPEEQEAEVLNLPTGPEASTVTVTTNLFDRQISFVARNSYDVPVEVVLALDELHNLELPRPEQSMRWVIGPKQDLVLLQLHAIDDNIAPQAEYRFIWLPGDPEAVHDADHLYRVPFAVARDYPITQAFPIGITHLTADSYYAVDLAMPIGTGVYAARAGMVFEVASTNFRGGTDPDEFSKGSAR
jgi:murein DD-endopeptidase MepM/ murein hydrolase activator NlpD